MHALKVSLIYAHFSSEVLDSKSEISAKSSSITGFSKHSPTHEPSTLGGDLTLQTLHNSFMYSSKGNVSSKSLPFTVILLSKIEVSNISLSPISFSILFLFIIPLQEIPIILIFSKLI